VLNALAGIGLTDGVDGLLLDGNTIRDNGQTTANTYNGIDLSPSVASTNIRLIGNMSCGAPQKYSLVITAQCSNVTIVGNQLPGNTTGAIVLTDARVIVSPSSMTPC
jgi:hypothetical protein